MNQPASTGRGQDKLPGGRSLPQPLWPPPRSRRRQAPACAASAPPTANRQRAAFGLARRGILGPCQNEESPAQIAELPGCSRTATGRKVSALRSMPGRRRTNWPRITGKQSQAGALIRTRPTIATERGTGASSGQDAAASSTALRANAATGIRAPACRLRGWDQPGNGGRPNLSHRSVLRRPRAACGIAARAAERPVTVLRAHATWG